jgi:23S rRNA (guanosine2251-2'-O)-methyltransferase
MIKLGARELRHTKPEEEHLQNIKRNPIYLVLDRVLDTYNIGSLFRLADAVASEKLYICGESEYPPSSRIHKSAVGTEDWQPWEKRDTAAEVVRELKEKGVQIIVVEQDPRSIELKDLNPEFPIAIVVGHETDGVSKEVLDLADAIIELPQYGVNKSFNVWGSAAVVAYRVLESL